MKYKLLVSREGVNQVKVFKKDTNGSYANDWNFPLKGDDEPIILSEFYTDSEFAVINWNGWIRLYDATKKEEIFNFNLKGNLNSKAIFSLDKSKIYIGFEDKNSKNVLATLCLKSKEMEYEDFEHFNSFLQIRRDGCLLLYKHYSEFVGNKEIYKHGYTIFNPEKKQFNFYSLPYAKQDWMEIEVPFLDSQSNIGVMPFYGEVPLTMNSEKEQLFGFNIIIFDLNTFEYEIETVRDFKKNQLGCYDYNCEEMASHFLNPSDDEDYIESLREFCDDLNSIVFEEDGFWLCWRGGVLRKVYHDKKQSPLLVTSSKSNEKEKGIFQFPFFHSYIYKIEGEKFYLFEHSDYYTFEIPEIRNQKSDLLIPIHLEKISLDEVENLTLSEDNLKEIENLNNVVILVNDLSNEDDQINALKQIEIKLTSIESLGVGKELIFKIQDKSGTVLNEEDFFENVIQLAEAPIVVAKIIENFCNYSEAKYTYRNPEETALCHAVFALAKQGESYLHTILKYLDTIDLDHDVFNRENLIPFLDESYSKEFLIKKIQSISDDLLGWMTYYWEEMEY